MPTVIDSFVAEFTIDPTDFQTGANNVRLNLKRVREDVEKSGKTTEDFGKQGAAALSKLKNEAVGLFLAFQGASSVKNFVTDLLTGDAATGRLAQNIGMATSRLSGWQLAIQSIGGEAADADAALQAMTGALQSYKLTGTTGHDTDFRGLGVTLGDLSQGPEHTLLRIAEAAKRMPPQEYFERLSRLGLSPATINLLRQGRDAVEQMVDAREREGAATDANAKAAERLQKKLSDFKSKLLGETRPAVYALVDGLEKVDDNVGLVNVALPILIGLLGAAAVATVAAAAPWIAMAAAIAAVVVGVKKYGDYVEKTRQDRADEVGAARVHFDQATGHNTYTAAQVRSATGRPVDAETLREINAGPKGPGPAGPAGDREAYLRSQGLTAEQARGVAAGIKAEGGGLGMARNGALGLGQWRGTRKKALFARYGLHPTEKQQLDFLVWELKGGDRGGKSVMAQRDAHSTMVSYLRDFMRPHATGRIGDLIADIDRGRKALGLGGSAPRVAAAGGNGGGVNIGTIVVNAPHADPRKVADAIPDAMKRRGVVARANRGLS